MLRNKKLTEEQRLQKAVIDIMGHPRYTALSGVLMVGSRKVIDGLPTAGTNGRDEFYGREFVAKLSDAELRFLVLHECYHKLYRHLTTWRWMHEVSPQLANIAFDQVINIKISDDNQDGFATMTGELAMGCRDEKYRGWDSAAVFHDLQKKAQQQGGQGQGQSQGQSQSQGQPDDGSGNGGHGSFDDHDWDGAQEMDAEAKKQLERDIDEAIRQGALLAGKTGSGGARELVELVKPQVDWREVLREFITSNCAGSDYSTYNRPNRRYMTHDVYMPSSISESVGEVVNGVDMSGSIGPRPQSILLSEVDSVCRTMPPEKMHIMYWDTEVCKHEVYEGDNVPEAVHSTKPAGGGGTLPSCVPEYMREHGISPQVAIILTDGHVHGWGEWQCPVLWVILDNKTARPPHGVFVHVDSETM